MQNSELRVGVVGYKDYEILIANILQGISNLEGLKKSTVKHNIQMKGLSGAEHQIDVYWEFELGPLTYKTVVQAKSGNKRVDLPTFMTFKGVLDDLEGRPRGMIATRSGYHKGNIDKVAKAYDISMFIVDAIPGIEVHLIDETLSVTLKSFRLSEKYDPVALRNIFSKIEIDRVTVKGKNSGVLISADALKDMVLNAALLKNAGSESGEMFAFLPKEPLLLPITGGHNLTIVEVISEIVRHEISRKKRVALSQHLVRSATGDKKYVVDNSFRVRKLD